MITLYTPQVLLDETFYPSIPLRLINGDSLVQDEWHITQFSSLFLYLPVRIWISIKGSTDGIILFLRYMYLTIHTITTVGIYTYLRKYGIWAIAAAILFYTQTPYRIMAISYHSIFVIFLLLFTFFLLLIHRKNSSLLYVSAGICFGACCVSNPLFCAVFVLYIILCIIWRKKGFLQSKIIKINSKQSKKNDIQNVQKLLHIKTYNCFFSKDAILFLSCGLSITAIISVVFFFATGGSISSILKNIGYILSSSEYGMFSSLEIKLVQTIKAFNTLSFNMPFLLPALYTVLLFDKNRKNFSHKIIYLILSLIIEILFIFGIINAIPEVYTAFAFSLPFTVISTVCYILTENKNKNLFYCMWCPCAIGAIIQLIASNTLLTASSVVLALNNIAGVIFVCDLIKEINADLKNRKKSFKNINDKRSLIVCRSVVCVSFCLQLLFQCFAYQYERIPEKDYKQVTTGPFAGFYMNELYYDNYVTSINDLDVIKSRGEEDAPVLIVSCHNWMYLYIDRPFANFTAWQETFQPEHLKLYYKQNPNKIPKYIYVGYAASEYIEMRDKAREKAAILNEMFVCTQEELSNGILLTVEQCKF